MIASIIEFSKPIDFDNGILPFLLSIPVALYTGLIASRAFAFFQARYRAAVWIYGLNNLFREDGVSPHEFNRRLSNEILPLMVELRALGHEDARETMWTILTEYQEAMARLLNLPFSKVEIPNFPDQLDELQQMLFGDKLRTFYFIHLAKNVVAIAKMKPSLGALINLRPFPNYVGTEKELFGLGTRRISLADKINRFIHDRIDECGPPGQ